MAEHIAYLVDRRRKLCAIKDLAQLCGAEVRDADAARQTLLLDRLHCLPHRLQASRLFVKHGGVDEKKIDIVELELFERLDERVPHGLALSQSVQLRGDEQPLAGLPRGGDARAEVFLVFVHLRAVEVRDARVDRGGHQVLRILLVVRSSGAERQQGYRGAVVQLDRSVRHRE